jgi:LuxR family quorum sensing-dependent transcriptional regulator
VLERGRHTSEYVTRCAFDTIAAVQGVASLAELNELFGPAIGELGFSLFAGIRLDKADRRLAVHVLFGAGCEPWLTHYIEKGYAPDDDILQRCFGASEPFCWNDVIERGHLSAKTLRIVADARHFGLTEGFIVPMPRPDSSILAVLFAGEYFDREDPSARTKSHLLANYYGIVGSRLYAQEASAATQRDGLTRRQRECLKWVLLGKSSRDIADILAISARVVDEHIANACKRLGVRTRAQAVIAASSRGYLDS